MEPDEQMPHAATPEPTDDRPPNVEVEVPSAPEDDIDEDEATDLDLTPLPDLRGDGP